MKLRDVAERLGCRLEGDGDVDILRVAGIDQAGTGDLTFFANPRYTAELKTTAAAAVILAEDGPAIQRPALRTPNPYLAFAQAVAMFTEPVAPPVGIHPLAAIDPEARIGADVSMGAFVVIAAECCIGRKVVLYPNVTIGYGAQIGDETIVHSNVSIRERVRIGARVVIQNGAVIGSEGFGFAQRADGTRQKIPQHGEVVIEDDVEIGANTTIDRPAVGETRVCRGTKLDNLIQVGHGVRIGRNAVIAAQVGIAGSSEIGDGVVLAGQVGVASHLRIGDRSKATAQTGIPNSLPDDSYVSGYPAIDNRDWLKASALFRRLPELRKTVRDLEARLEALERRLGGTLPGSR